jgi:hypothetical protein
VTKYSALTLGLPVDLWFRSAFLQRANLGFAGRFMVSASVFLHFDGKPKVKPLEPG